MKFKICLSLLIEILFTQTLVPSDYTSQGSSPLRKYATTAKEKEKEHHRIACGLRFPDDPLDAATLALLTASASAIGGAPLAGLYGGFGVMSALTANHFYRLYRINAPYGFADSLKYLEPLIDHKKSIIIGGKEYMLAKDFNEAYNTGYATMNMRGQLSRFDYAASYEIYLMPDHKDLVSVFEAIAKALHEQKNQIAFIAIRPTPVLTNDQKQILPRIVIALRDSFIGFKPNFKGNKTNAENILRTVYNTLKKIPNIKASGAWPRYSEKVRFASILGKQLMPKPDTALVFVGLGNTDEKQEDPNLYERKKFLGIPRNDDMAYPKNIPETDKIGVVIVGK